MSGTHHKLAYIGVQTPIGARPKLPSHLLNPLLDQGHLSGGLGHGARVLRLLRFLLQALALTVLGGHLRGRRGEHLHASGRSR